MDKAHLDLPGLRSDPRPLLVEAIRTAYDIPQGTKSPRATKHEAHMAEEKKTDAIATQNTALARPSFLGQNDTRGAENITKEDIQMPRIGIGQPQSPEVIDGDPKRIADLKPGMFFHNLTRQIIPAPLNFTVIRTERPRFIEFIPRAQGGGIKDYNVPPDDPRTLFTTGPDGKPVPPVATKFYDFILMLLPINPNDPMSSIIALSLKSSGIAVARALNGFIKLRNAPSFAGKYTMKTVSKTNSKGTWFLPVIDNAGWCTEEEFKVAELAYQSLSGRTVRIEVDEEDEDGIPAAAAGTEATAQEVDTRGM